MFSNAVAASSSAPGLTSAAASASSSGGGGKRGGGRGSSSAAANGFEALHDVPVPAASWGDYVFGSGSGGGAAVDANTPPPAGEVTRFLNTELKTTSTKVHICAGALAHWRACVLGLFLAGCDST